MYWQDYDMKLVLGASENEENFRCFVTALMHQDEIHRKVFCLFVLLAIRIKYIL
jgi:hypothetical protein